MEPTAAFSGVLCKDCGRAYPPDRMPERCPDCGGLLETSYSIEPDTLTRSALETDRFESMWRYDRLLPVRRSNAVSMREGNTPLVACPSLADSLGVGAVYVKDESRNPTGSITDRGVSVATSVVNETGGETVSLADPGNGGQSAAAYAARAGLDARVYLPSRTGFDQKAMVNVHGADLTVVNGRYEDAMAAYRSARRDNGWSAIGSDSPFRVDGAKTVLFEIVEQLDWQVPDAVVHPTGAGTGLLGLFKGGSELEELGFVNSLPPLYAAQPSGCQPIVEAFETGTDRHEAWDTPDTICGEIEVPDPPGSHYILNALRTSGGGAVAATDEEILDAGIDVAQQTGLEFGASAAAAAGGAFTLADRGTFYSGDTVVLINTGSANKEADVLRNALRRKGI
ncbi:MAG: threonine synthase [Halodesulfurarchaeum sp.]